MAKSNGTGTGYYGCMLPIFEPGQPPRMLMQYSRPYRGSCVNVIHRMITLADAKPGVRHDRHNIGEADLKRILAAANAAGVAVIGMD